MSTWKFKNAQKAQDHVILYFSDASRPLWGDTMSVTLPAADAEKLRAKLQAILGTGKP